MQLLFLYSNSISQIYELYHSNIRTPSLNAKSNPLPTHLTQSCLRLCRAHCLDFPIVSVCRDATEAPVGKVTVAKDRPIIYSGLRRPQKGPISWRNPIQTSTSTKRARFMDEWTDRRLLRHVEMALEYLWAGVPCQRSAGYRQETGFAPVPDSLATRGWH